ncbi:Tubulin polyglutamylase TTLL4 [Holothuria leucospilota]|uniref:Tubulin polyglutamylase TTLL4 n=1 Tax=Holothuria leucospilota TaxID=206669 RepID=A0A9Q0YM54_HOLLE|nr:Tubulin polyglutamylase TTLL4 [Holothuria leucospilota]
MATANEIDEIRSTLQRGLENLALSGNLKPLPLRQQAERPVLRSPLKVNRNGNELINGRAGSFQRSLSSDNDFKPDTSYRNPPDGSYEKQQNGRRPVSARSKATKRSPRDGSHSGTQIYSRVQMHSKPPTGRPRYSRPSSGRSHTTPTAARLAAQKESAERLQRGRTPSQKKPAPTPKSPKSIYNDGDPKASANFGKVQSPPKNGFFLYDSENDGEEWYDVEEENEDNEGDFNPLDHERLPGDGASLDDFDEDDGLDGLDDEDYEDDGSDGYSIASGHSYKLPIDTAVSPKSINSLSQEGTNGFTRSILASRTGSSMLHLLTSGNDEAHPALSPSLFSNVPPTINFVGDGEKVVPLPWDLRKLLKWRMSTVTPHVVKNCIARSGFRATKKANEWIGYWGKHMKGSGFRAIKEYQKINHFPGSFQIGRKDRLWKNLYKMQLHYGKKEYNFCPQTFVLPYDLKLLKRAWEDGSSKQKWILKPPASARGIGVRVIHKWSQIPRRKAVIVQKYLSKPYLINGSKFDLRLYVYIPSFDPLRIFVYYDGLTRFATMKYSASMKSLNNRYMHLTNYSINKKSSEFTSNDDTLACEGHKWSLVALWGFLKQKGVDTAAVQESIKDLIIKTVICSDSAVNSMIKANVRSRYSVHELFGFDVMLDENLKPWIIEVNVSPSLHSNSPLDISIKGGLVKDLHNMAGFHIPDKRDIYPTLQPPSATNAKDIYKDIVLDKRMYTNHLSQDERAKHAFYTQKHLDEDLKVLIEFEGKVKGGQIGLPSQCRSSVLDTLTPDDLRCLILTEDEVSRCGHFDRIFPSPNTHKYHRFFESPRYYNILLDEWVRKYSRQHSKGLSLLEDFCAEKVHLGLCKDSSHVWTPISSVLVARDFRTSSAPSSSIATPTHPSLKKSSSAHSLPKIRRKVIKGRSLSSNGSMASMSHMQPHPPFQSSSHYNSGYSTPS